MGWGAFKQFLYGLTGYEFVRHALEVRRELEAVFMVVTMGDLIGVPILTLSRVTSLPSSAIPGRLA